MFMLRKKKTRKHEITPDGKIQVEMTTQDRELILDHTFADPEYAERLHGVPDSKKLVGTYTLDELEDLAGFIAHEANHTEDAKLERKLDSLFEGLDYILDTHGI